MKIKKSYKLIGECFIFLLLIFFDQFTKYLAITNLKFKNPIILINNVFEFRYLENSGAAFGILKNKIIIFTIITIIVIVTILLIKHKINSLIYSDKIEKKLKNKFLLLDIILLILVSGALGNFIDRVRLDYVIDFIYFRLIDFPIFNLADCYVSISAFMLIFMFIFIIKDNEYQLLFFSKKMQIREVQTNGKHNSSK